MKHLFLVLCYINFFPLQVTYFRALPHSLGYIFQYIFLSLMILNIMHHVHDCNRVLEVRRGLVVSIVLFPPTSLKDRVIKALELCSCGKEKKNVWNMWLIGKTHHKMLTENICLLTGGNWQKWKRVFLTCPCHEIYRDEAVGLKSCKNTWKITIFVKMWNLGQYRENLIFC